MAAVWRFTFRPAVAMSEYPNAHRHPPMRSRSQIALDDERRQAQERAELASANAASRVLNRGSFSLGRFGTVEGRQFEVVSTDAGIAIMDPARVLTNKFVFGLVGNQPSRLVETLERVVWAPVGVMEDVPVVDQVARLVRTWAGVAVREQTITVGANGDQRDAEIGWRPLFEMNGDQAAQLVAVLRRAG